MLRNKFAPFLRGKQAGEVTSLDIVRRQGWVDALRQRSGKPYSQTYVRALNGQVSSLFNYAGENYGLKPNPTKKVKKTGSARSAEMQFWAREEYDAFLHAVSNKDLSFYAFEILYWTGIREGELLALCPADIDLDAGALRVCKTYARKDGQDYIGPPKTRNSCRTVVMPDFLSDELRVWFDGAGFAEGERIFPFTKSYLWREMQRGCAKSG